MADPVDLGMLSVELCLEVLLDHISDFSGLGSARSWALFGVSGKSHLIKVVFESSWSNSGWSWSVNTCLDPRQTSHCQGSLGISRVELCLYIIVEHMLNYQLRFTIEELRS